MTAQILIKELKSHSSPARKKSNEWFFKTGKGQYGEGDKFIGVRVPHIRQVVNHFIDLDFVEIKKCMRSEMHEVRLAGVLILVINNKLALKYKDKQKQKKILNFYLRNKAGINNWDLVDLSAHYILGQAILDNLESKQMLFQLAKSKNLWERRIAIISTWIFIRQGEVKICLRVSRLLLNDKEDLIHKAVGWMLREAWKKNALAVEKFLIQNYTQMPRTTLRYTIERMSEIKRQRFLKGQCKGLLSAIYH